MAKQKRKASILKSRRHQGQTFEETFDDSLLPDANEIKKLSELDPNIIQWLKDRAEKEQSFRHNVHSKKIDLVSKVEKGLRWINYLGLLFSFLLLGGGMFLSYTLINSGHEILGIFSGAVLVLITSIFMSKVRSNNNEDTPKR